MERFKVCVAVHLLLIENDKLLLQKRINCELFNNKYGLVAGHINGNEDVISAIIREAKEEINIEIRKEDLHIVQVMNMKSISNEYCQYFFTVDKYIGNIINNEPNKCSELKWFNLNELPDTLIEYERVAIKHFLEDPQNPFTFFGWEDNK
jgi:ADP-ribose pyrophosphatase YjhB (NUDIX family)